jgi:hypothetical protein
LKKLFVACIGFAALALVIKATAAKKLSFDVKNIFIQRREGKYQLFCRVAIDNPTKETITINGVNLNFFHGQDKLGSVVYNVKTIFAPAQKTEVAFPVNVLPKNFLSLLQDWFKGNNLIATARGTVNFAGFNIPVEKQINLL